MLNNQFTEKSPEVPPHLPPLFFVQVEIIILFYILLITAVIAIPKKSLVSIANDKLFFPLFHLISSEVAKSLLTDHYSSRELPDTWGEIFS